MENAAALWPRCYSETLAKPVIVGKICCVFKEGQRFGCFVFGAVRAHALSECLHIKRLRRRHQIQEDRCNIRMCFLQ